MSATTDFNGKFVDVSATKKDMSRKMHESSFEIGFQIRRVLAIIGG